MRLPYPEARRGRILVWAGILTPTFVAACLLAPFVATEVERTLLGTHYVDDAIRRTGLDGPTTRFRDLFRP